MGKGIGKNISKNLIGKYSQKRLDYAKKSATDPLKTSTKSVIQKAAETAGDLISNRIANKRIKVSQSSQQDNSKTVLIEHDKEIPKERYISPEKRQGIIDDLRLI